MADFSVNSTPLAINGQPLGGGFSFAYDLGGSTLDYANQAYAFLNANQTQNQSFLSQSIAGTQTFLSHQLTPLTQQIAATQANNAAMIPTAINNFNQMMTDQTNAFINAVNTGYGTIAANTANTNQSNVQISDNNSGSLICTELYNRKLLTLREYRKMGKLYAYVRRHDYSKLKKYQRRARLIMRNIKDRDYKSIKKEYIDDIVELIDTEKLNDAFCNYTCMMYKLNQRYA